MDAPPLEYLSFFTIYDHPRDHPGFFVMRECRVYPDGRVEHAPLCVLALTLEQARRAIPEWAVNLGRQDEDDPAIFEVWV